MRILIVLFAIVASCGASAATDVDRFVAAYQQKNSAMLMPFLKVYQGTSVYPYILVRQLGDSVVKQAVVNPSVATLFNQYPHSMASQKLRISYLKYWAQQRNWNNYALYYRGLEISAVGEDAEFDCTALNFLAYRNKNYMPYLLKVTTNVDKVSDNCLKTLNLALVHGIDPNLVQHKVLEIASSAKAADFAIVRSNVQQWPDSTRKTGLLHGLSLIAQARNHAQGFSASASDRVFLPYVAMALTQAHQPQADILFTKHQVYGLKAAPIALDWTARTALFAHNWQGMIQTIRIMEKKQSDKPIWRYWLAYALLRCNKDNEAALIFKQLSMSTDYYGWLARQQTHIGLPVSNLQQDRVVVDTVNIAIRNPKLGSIQQLHKAGLWVEAAQEMNLMYQNASPQQYWIGAKVAQHIGLIERQINYAEKAGVLDWSTRFPQPYQKLVLQESKRSVVDPALVAAVMRQESRFMPHAYSPVGATGLMQLMPATAKSMARRLGLKSETNTASLFQPEVNIMLGSEYLKVLENSGLRNARVIASYNAGMGRINQWNVRTQRLTASEWVELIPFDETRNYVKNVLSNQAYYRYLLDGQNVNFDTMY